MACAQALAPVLGEFQYPTPDAGPSHHSDSIVVVDPLGNVAALVYSINTVLWDRRGS